MARSTLFASALLALLAIPSASSVASPVVEPRPEPRHLRGKECLDPVFARSFTTIDQRSLVVDAGRYLYLIEVPVNCWAIEHTTSLLLRGDPISRRVCGGGFDAVLSSRRNEPPCPIERMTILDREQYEAALDRREQWIKERQAARKASRADKD